MTEVRQTLSLPASDAHEIVPGVRPLTAEETGHLDRARTHLRASGVDLADARAVGALLHTMRSRWAVGPAAGVPQATVMALGVGVGDLIVHRVPGARWALRTKGPAPTPTVVSASGTDAALPLADVAARWQTGCGPEWVAEYVAAAAAHLAADAGHEVPSPRRPSPNAFRTPADLPFPPSPAAQDIALGVLDQVLEAALTPGRAAVPFAVVDGGPAQDPAVRSFDGEADARAWVRGSGAARAAVAWFGQLPTAGSAEPAVLVEASDAGAPSLVVAHRYVAATAGDDGRARAVGGPLVLGQAAPLL
ncbi:hypothetical protein ASE38_02915 [Cellulomonas sp. Root930]|nr:hypothetical protein ASE38_02915 [Cellulomonas sp. Root930]